MQLTFVHCRRGTVPIRRDIMSFGKRHQHCNRLCTRLFSNYKRAEQFYQYIHSLPFYLLFSSKSTKLLGLSRCTSFSWAPPRACLSLCFTIWSRMCVTCERGGTRGRCNCFDRGMGPSFFLLLLVVVAGLFAECDLFFLFVSHAAAVRAGLGGVAVAARLFRTSCFFSLVSFPYCHLCDFSWP